MVWILNPSLRSPASPFIPQGDTTSGCHARMRRVSRFASTWASWNSPGVGARLATTQRTFTAKVMLNIEDTPGMQWIRLAQGHHHLHLLLGRGSGGTGRFRHASRWLSASPAPSWGDARPRAPSPGTQISSGSVTRRLPGLLPGRTGRSRDATREPSTAERIQLGFGSRSVS